MQKIRSFIKDQPVLVIAFIAAAVTMMIIPPDSEYSGYINRAVLIQLFSLMTAIAGLRSIGVFERATSLLLTKANTTRRLGQVYVLVCFFTSMLVTNDVALLTFVPITLMTLKKAGQKSIILIVVLETAAANLGSMLTPIGNPQNLYIYDFYKLSALVFIKTMAPAGLASIVLLMLLTLLIPNEKCALPQSSEQKVERRPLIGYTLLFVICILTVLRAVPDLVCLLAALLCTLILDKKLLTKVDYPLLMTFICFFVFVGNIARIGAVNDLVSTLIQGRAMIISTLLSQFISNVPAAVMLSGFTNNGTQLLLGVNLGGLGTVIASLASLISFQFYRKTEGSDSVRYMAVFSVVGFGMLMILLLFEMLILMI